MKKSPDKFPLTEDQIETMREWKNTLEKLKEEYNFLPEYLLFSNEEKRVDRWLRRVRRVLTTDEKLSA